jgi:hypothetical protein
MQPNETVIPKERATFWMDGHGRWHNQHGPFENKKIIDYFNASIRWDLNGYYVTQQNTGLQEKVYFPYEDTALFVEDILAENAPTILLNTRARIPLQPDKLFVCNDQLYLQHENERIKFKERALLKIAKRIECEKSSYFWLEAGERHLIPSNP